jgi:hypothetical protein
LDPLDNPRFLSSSEKLEALKHTIKDIRIFFEDEVLDKLIGVETLNENDAAAFAYNLLQSRYTNGLALNFKFDHSSFKIFSLKFVRKSCDPLELMINEFGKYVGESGSRVSKIGHDLFCLKYLHAVSQKLGLGISSIETNSHESRSSDYWIFVHFTKTYEVQVQCFSKHSPHSLLLESVIDIIYCCCDRVNTMLLLRCLRQTNRAR